MLPYFSKNYFSTIYPQLYNKIKSITKLSLNTNVPTEHNHNVSSLLPSLPLQETEKVIALHSQLEQEQSKKNTLLSEVSLKSSEVAHLKSREIQLVKEVTQLRETKRKFEDDIVKIKNAHNVDILQVFINNNYFFLYFHIIFLLRR